MRNWSSETHVVKRKILLPFAVNCTTDSQRQAPRRSISFFSLYWIPQQSTIHVLLLLLMMMNCCHATTKTNHHRRRLVVCVLLLLLGLLPQHALVVSGKELVATHEWQRVGPDETLPAGLEIRMDLDQGGTWVRLPPDKEKESQPPHHPHRCGPSCHERLAQAALRRRGLRGGSSNHNNAAPSDTAVPNERMVQRVLWVLSLTIVGILISHYCK